MKDDDDYYRACKHLDYDGDYVDCTIRTCEPAYPEVRYWERGDVWTDNGPGMSPNPRKVQFCKLCGRINSIFNCYQAPGVSGCYEVEEEEEK